MWSDLPAREGEGRLLLGLVVHAEEGPDEDVPRHEGGLPPLLLHGLGVGGPHEQRQQAHDRRPPPGRAGHPGAAAWRFTPRPQPSLSPNSLRRGETPLRASELGIFSFVHVVGGSRGIRSRGTPLGKRPRLGLLRRSARRPCAPASSRLRSAGPFSP